MSVDTGFVQDTCVHGTCVHGTCVAVGEAGVLVRGASGSGKSALALALVEAAAARGLFARLVADDRVVLAVVHGRLVARPHPALAGLVEERGIGVVPVPHLAAAVVRLVVDLEPEPERLPEHPVTEVEGVRLPRLALPAGRADPRAVLGAVFRPSCGASRAADSDPVAATPRS